MKERPHHSTRCAGLLLRFDRTGELNVDQSFGGWRDGSRSGQDGSWGRRYLPLVINPAVILQSAGENAIIGR
jgi:hypothetical protein